MAKKTKQPQKRFSVRAKKQAHLAVEALVHCQELGLSDDECVLAAKLMLRTPMLTSAG